MKRRAAAQIIALSVLVSVTAAHAQDFDKGLAAARAGDFGSAIREWRPLAEGGHIEAQFYLGAIFEEGLGVPKDPAAAAGWYALAAGRGHVRAQYNLGVMYADGRGVARDDSRAATWLRKAAEQEHGKAQYNLAVLYQSGRGVPKDPAQAREWFERAAANGVSVARAESAEPEPAAPTELRSENRRSDSAGSNPNAASDSTQDKNQAPILPPEAAPVMDKAIGLNLYDADDVILPKRPATQDPISPADPASDPPAGPNIASLPPEQLRITAELPEGTRYRLEVMETRQRRRDGAIVMAQTSELDVEMVVITDSSSGALIEWTFGPAKIKTAGDQHAGRLASELGKLIDGQKVAYHTNQNGEVTTLENPAQLTSFYEKSIDRVTRALGAQAADPRLVDDIRSNLAQLLSQDRAAARALELPKLLHFFTGLELAAGKTYSRAARMNLPPSIEALPSTLDYQLKWFDRTAGVAWLHWSQSVNPEQAAGAVKAYVKTLAAEQDIAVPEEFSIGAIEVSDSADYEIDLQTGFPKQVIYTRNVELFGFSQTEKRRIRVIR